MINSIINSISNNNLSGYNINLYDNCNIDSNNHLINESSNTINIFNNTSFSNRLNIQQRTPPVRLQQRTPPVRLSRNNILRTNYAKHARAPEPRTKIGNDVWIGLNVIIIAGVRIGDGAVIGAGSVVTKDVPSYAIWAGIPARQIRERFDKETIRKLKALSWWNWPEEQIVRLATFFDDPKKLLKSQGIE